MNMNNKEVLIYRLTQDILYEMCKLERRLNVLKKNTINYLRVNIN